MMNARSYFYLVSASLLEWLCLTITLFHKRKNIFACQWSKYHKFIAPLTVMFHEAKIQNQLFPSSGHLNDYAAHIYSKIYGPGQKQ